MRMCAVRRFVLLFGSVALGASLHAAEPKRTITHADLWLMPRVGAPALSPNGRWAVVPVAEPSYEPDGQSVDLWLVDTDGKQAPRRLTSGKEA